MARVAELIVASLLTMALGLRQGDEITYVGIGPGGNGETVLGLHESPVAASIGYWKEKSPEVRSEPPYRPPADWTYNTQGGPVEGKINVHLVPHTHDDTGWQVTVDQYFYREVYYVIDTVVKELALNPSRHFTYVETAFFARWWEEQSPKTQELTKSLVANGQLEFINGGWCMHDEASPLYTEMVDQTTRGHQFLYKHFNVAPRGTWQVDPFGHSQTQAWLLSAEAGMESLFWGRTDYQDFAARKDSSRLEWLWEGSQSLGSSARVFAGALYGTGGGGYSSWVDFDGSDNQIQDDPRRHDYNVDEWVDRVVTSALDQANHTRTDHQLWAVGTDFQYQNADHWYHNLDKLIHYVNQNGTINVFYSTPSLYVDAKKKAGLEWEVRRDDVMPLADNAHHYWTGYFTSRPALKKQVRRATNFLSAARIVEVLSGVTAAEVDTPTVRPSPVVGTSWTDSLEGTIGVATHHDGMSGTERQSVSDDYEQRIAESLIEAEAGFKLSLYELLGFSEEITDREEFVGSLDHCACNENLGGCLNMSVCTVTTDAADGFGIVAMNPQGKTTSTVVSVPVSGGNWTIRKIDENSSTTLPSQLIPIDDRTKELPLLYLNSFGLTAQQVTQAKTELTNNATHLLVFRATVPAVGHASYRATRGGVVAEAETTVDALGEEPLTVVSDFYSLSFNGETGMLESVTNLKSNTTAKMQIDWGWYNSSEGGCTAGIKPESYACDDQSSGAYMFRPNTSTVFPCGPAQPKIPTTVIRGEVVTEVRQHFSDWATHVIRLYAGSPYIEVEWTAGPIPMTAPWINEAGKNETWGKEVIVRYSSNLVSNKTFFADSNGREMVRRIVDQRGPAYPQPYNVSEPVAGNYYPVNSMIAIQDDQHQLAVVTDVTMGGASLRDGEIELMVHRRVMKDDSRGVQEPLNETMCGCNDINAEPGKMGKNGKLGDGGCWCEGLTMRGKHWVVLDTIESANALRRQLIEDLNFEPSLTFSKDPGFAPPRPHATALSAELPPNVKLMTLTKNYEAFNDGAWMLRFAHLYSVGEHPTLSGSVDISLKEIFGKAGLQLVSAEETSLTGNMAISELDKRRQNGFKGDGDVDGVEPSRSRLDPNDETLSFTIGPMQLRTFKVHFAKS